MKFSLPKYLIAAGICALTLSACDDIDENSRYITTESVKPVRAVLIEDFTGQECRNCPRAHETIEALVAQYGDAVIPVAIHCGGFGVPTDNTRYTGLMQPEGNTYNDAWGITEWPKGVVNRTGGALNDDRWATAVRTELERETPLSIGVTAACAGGTSDIAIEITLEPTADVTGHLQVWIVEDGIVTRQRNENGRWITDYVHNHVYRASVNGVGGQEVNLRAHVHNTVELTQPLRDTPTEKWNAANLSVVAFVYNGSGVIQAARAAVSVQP